MSKHVRWQVCDVCGGTFDATTMQALLGGDGGAICRDCARKRKGKQ